MPEDIQVNPEALQRLADSIRADLNAELDRCEAAGEMMSPKANQLLAEMAAVAQLALLAK